MIKTTIPRSALIRCIAEDVYHTLDERQISLIDYLKELAIIIEAATLVPANCIVLKNNQHFVFMPNSCSEPELIDIIARIRLRHIRFYNFYSNEFKKILDQEIALFYKYYTDCRDATITNAR